MCARRSCRSLSLCADGREQCPACLLRHARAAEGRILRWSHRGATAQPWGAARRPDPRRAAHNCERLLDLLAWDVGRGVRPKLLDLLALQQWCRRYRRALSNRKETRVWMAPLAIAIRGAKGWCWGIT